MWINYDRDDFIYACLYLFMLISGGWSVYWLWINSGDGRDEMYERRRYTESRNNIRSVMESARIKVAVRALPPVTAFHEYQTTESQNLCPICIHHFSDGDLVQPFGVCSHRFHPSCIKSWLFLGKINCPLCRMKLSLTSHR